MAKSSQKYQPSPLVHKSCWKVSPNYWSRSLCSLKGSTYLPADPTAPRTALWHFNTKTMFLHNFCDFSKPFFFFSVDFTDYMSWFQKGPLLLKPNKRLDFCWKQAVSPDFIKVDFFTALRFLKDTQKKSNFWKFDALLPSGQGWTCTAVHVAVMFTSKSIFICWSLHFADHASVYLVTICRRNCGNSSVWIVYFNSEQQRTLFSERLHVVTILKRGFCCFQENTCVSCCWSSHCACGIPIA